MAPVLEELASRYTGQVKFAVLNVDTDGAVASSYNVTGVPILFFYNRGKLVDRAVGGISRLDIERYLQALVRPA